MFLSVLNILLRPARIPNILSLALIAIVAIAIVPAAANAKTVRLSKSVSSGKSAKIDTFMGWNNDCSFQTISIDVVDKPKSGRANARVIKSKIARAQAGSAGNCLGKPIQGLGLYYKSKSGYHGTDKIKVKMSVRGQAPVYFIYTIRVR